MFVSNLIVCCLLNAGTACKNIYDLGMHLFGNCWSLAEQRKRIEWNFIAVRRPLFTNDEVKRLRRARDFYR